MGLVEATTMAANAPLVEAFFTRDSRRVSDSNWLPFPFCPFRHFPAAIEAGRKPFPQANSAGPGLSGPVAIPFPRAVPQATVSGRDWKDDSPPDSHAHRQWYPERSANLIHSQPLAAHPAPPTTATLWKALLGASCPQLLPTFEDYYAQWDRRPEVGYVLDCAALGMFPVVTPRVLRALRQMPSLARPWPGLAHLLQTSPAQRLDLPLFCSPGAAPPPHEVWIPKCYSMEAETIFVEAVPTILTSRSPLFYCWSSETPAEWRAMGDSPHAAAARIPRTFPGDALRSLWALRPGYLLSALGSLPPMQPTPLQLDVLRCRCCGTNCRSPQDLEAHYDTHHPSAITRVLQDAPWSEIRVAAALVAHILLSRPPPTVS
jgi:hypothetical protein